MAQKEEGWGAVGEKSASLLLKFSTGGHLGLKFIIDYILLGVVSRGERGDNKIKIRSYGSSITVLTNEVYAHQHNMYKMVIRLWRSLYI